MVGEAAFIAALRALPLHSAARGLADDCAVLKFGAETLVITHDTLVEGVHFLPLEDPRTDAADVAWKLVATNLSDLAAKGAAPVGVMLGYMLSGAEDRFLAGLAGVLAEYGVPLLGGDTVGAHEGACAYGMTAIGRATHTPVPSRGGASAGDGVYLCGTIGAAMHGLDLLTDADASAPAALTAAYRRPHALVEQGIALAPHVTAMMDVSDGLLLDASRMAGASGVMIDIETGAVPFCADLPASRRAAPQDDALRWGDDYALLFTASPDAAEATEKVGGVSRIGTVLPRAEHALHLDGTAPSGDPVLGYQHH
ncbi:MAG: thiamine-phosphate kinase [Parerythrobacter sp.]